MSEMLNADQWKAKAAGLSFQNKAFIGGRYVASASGELEQTVCQIGTRAASKTLLGLHEGFAGAIHPVGSEVNLGDAQ